MIKFYIVQHYDLSTKTWEDLRGYPPTANVKIAQDRWQHYRSMFTDKCYRIQTLAAN